MRRARFYCIGILIVMVAAFWTGSADLSAGRVIHRIGPTDQMETLQRNAVAAQPTPEPVLVARGEYKVYRQKSDGGIGPFNPAVRDFSEAWSLWRLPDGRLRVEGTRSFEAPEFDYHKDGFTVHLSPDFKLLSITEYAKLRWKADSGPLSCDFHLTVLNCNSGAKDPANDIRLRLPFKSAYGFLWPISAFSMGNITRFVPREPGAEIPVSMLVMDEPGPANPVLFSVLEGTLQFLEQEQITVAGRKWQAEKFKLQVALYPPFILWTSRQGLLLDMALEDNSKRMTERGMGLVRYEQLSDY